MLETLLDGIGGYQIIEGSNKNKTINTILDEFLNG